MNYIGPSLLCVVAFALHVNIEGLIPFGTQWGLLLSAAPDAFEEVMWWYSAMPRAVLAILIGATMGLVGSLFQQLLLNPLVSPTTLGTTSGAWFGIACGALFFDFQSPNMNVLFAIAGGLVASGLVVLIAGRSGLRGLPVILSGMAVSLFLGAVTTGLILLNEEYARNIFIWGAGDLTQTDWTGVQWLLPRYLIIPLLIIFAAKPLNLMRLGDEIAEGRGMSLMPAMIVIIAAGVWLTAVSITTVGLIGFIGLIAPNIAKMISPLEARNQMIMSMLVGAISLLLCDCLALWFTTFSPDLVPSGAAAALIGAPALIWLARGRFCSIDDGSRRAQPSARTKLNRVRFILLIAGAIVLAVVAVSLAPVASGAWKFNWPDNTVLSLRWPRILAAASAGIGLAVAGTILQRLIRNPLASPDLLGLSAGATLVLVAGVLLFGSSIREFGPLVGFMGCGFVIVLLLVLGRRYQYSPGIMTLMGISLAAFLDAIVQFALSQGNQSVYDILGWMSGSTYHVSEEEALILALGTIVGLGFSYTSKRGLTLIFVGDEFAGSRGLDVQRGRMLLLFLVAGLVALSTSVIGPIGFVGLLAPHIASIFGARKVVEQLLVASVMGCALMLLADWLGRVVLFPVQIPAGLLASVIGGAYFIWLLSTRRIR